eukprot:181799_1
MPVVNTVSEYEDWRLTFTLKIFDYLSEPDVSYWLTCALFSPEKNLIAPTYEMTAQSAYKYGPYAVAANSGGDNDVGLQIENKSKRNKKKKKKK